jgi:hypothetical protein
MELDFAVNYSRTAQCFLGSFQGMKLKALNVEVQEIHSFAVQNIIKAPSRNLLSSIFSRSVILCLSIMSM